jgi:exodeoxyribonuclease-1
MALANRFADRQPSPYPEATLYAGGFISNDDARACASWHASPWEDRVAISAELRDERLRAFANRLTLLEAPHTLSQAGWQNGLAWLRDRLTTQTDVPWLTLPKALGEVAILRRTLPVDAAARDIHLDAIERWLRDQKQFFQLAA